MRVLRPSASYSQSGTSPSSFAYVFQLDRIEEDADADMIPLMVFCPTRMCVYQNILDIVYPLILRAIILFKILHLDFWHARAVCWMEERI